MAYSPILLRFQLQGWTCLIKPCVLHMAHATYCTKLITRFESKERETHLAFSNPFFLNACMLPCNLFSGSLMKCHNEFVTLGRKGDWLFTCDESHFNHVASTHSYHMMVALSNSGG